MATRTAIVLLDLPPEVRQANQSIGAPLGTRPEVEAKIAACLPDLQLDGRGCGTLRRPAYTMEFRLEADDETVHAVFVTIEGDRLAFVPLRRLTQQTGWRPFDAQTYQAVDFATGDLPRPRATPLPEETDRLPTPWRSALAGFVLTSALALGGNLPQAPAAAARGSERQVMRDMAELERAEMLFFTSTGAYVEPEILATPSRLAGDLPSGRFLDGRFLQAVRGGYRFEFRGLEPNSRAPIQPAHDAYSYAAAPESGRGRTFAFYSYRSGYVYFREDGTLPTIDDQMLKLP